MALKATIEQLGQLDLRLRNIRKNARYVAKSIEIDRDIANRYENIITYVDEILPHIKDIDNSLVVEQYERLQQAVEMLEKYMLQEDYKVSIQIADTVKDVQVEFRNLAEENIKSYSTIDELNSLLEHIERNSKDIHDLKELDHVIKDIPIQVSLDPITQTQNIRIVDPKKVLVESNLKTEQIGKYIVTYDTDLITDPTQVFLDFYKETLEKDTQDKVFKRRLDPLYGYRNRDNSRNIVSIIDDLKPNERLYIRNNKRFYQYNPFINDKDFLSKLNVISKDRINNLSESFYYLPNKYDFLNYSISNRDVQRFKYMPDKSFELNRLDIPDTELLYTLTGNNQIDTPEGFKMALYKDRGVNIRFLPEDLVTVPISSRTHQFLGFEGTVELELNRTQFERVKQNQVLRDRYRIEETQSGGRLFIDKFKLVNRDINIQNKSIVSPRKGFISPITESMIDKFSNTLNRLGLQGNQPIWNKNKTGLFFDIETVSDKFLSIGFSYQDFNKRNIQNISLLNRNLSDIELETVMRTKSLKDYSSIGYLIDRAKKTGTNYFVIDDIHYFLQDLSVPESIDQVVKEAANKLNIDLSKQDFISGYNIKSFDIPRLRSQYSQSKFITDILNKPVVDVYDNIKGLLQRSGYNVTSQSLEEVQRILNVPIYKEHVDIFDALTTAEVARKLSNYTPFDFKSELMQQIEQSGYGELVQKHVDITGVETSYYTSNLFGNKKQIGYQDLISYLVDTQKIDLGKNYRFEYNQGLFKTYYTKPGRQLNVEESFNLLFGTYLEKDIVNKTEVINQLTQKGIQYSSFDIGSYYKQVKEINQGIKQFRNIQPFIVKTQVTYDKQFDMTIQSTVSEYQLSDKYKRNLLQFKKQFGIDINQLDYAIKQRFAEGIMYTREELDDIIEDIFFELNNLKNVDYDVFSDMFKQNLLVFKESEQLPTGSQRVQFEGMDLRNIDATLINEYKLNRVQELFSSISDDKLFNEVDQKFREFLSTGIEQLRSANKPDDIFLFVRNLNMFVPNMQQLEKASQDISVQEATARQVNKLRLFTYKDITNIDYELVNNPKMLKFITDVKSGREFQYMYETFLNQKLSQKDLSNIMFEFNNRTFNIDQSTFPRTDQVRWFINEINKQVEGFQYGENTIRNYMLSNLFEDDKLYNIKNLKLLDIISNFNNYSQEEISQQVTDLYDQGLLQYKPQLKGTDTDLIRILDQYNKSYGTFDLNALRLKLNKEQGTFLESLDTEMYEDSEEFKSDYLFESGYNKQVPLSVYDIYGDDIRKGFQKQFVGKDVSEEVLNIQIFNYFKNVENVNRTFLDDIKGLQLNKVIDNIINNPKFNEPGIASYIDNIKSKKVTAFSKDTYRHLENLQMFSNKTLQQTNYPFNTIQELLIAKDFYGNDLNQYNRFLLDKMSDVMSMNVDLNMYTTGLESFKYIFDKLGVSQDDISYVMYKDIVNRRNYLKGLGEYETLKQFDYVTSKFMQRNTPDMYNKLLDQVKQEVSSEDVFRYLNTTYNVGDVIYVNNRKFTVKSIDNLKGVVVKSQTGREYVLTDASGVSAKGNLNDVLLREIFKPDRQITAEKIFSENISKFESVLKTPADKFMFRTITQQQVHNATYNKDYIKQFIENTEYIKNKFGLSDDVLNSITGFMRSYEDILSKYKIDKDMLNKLIGKFELGSQRIPEIREQLQISNLQRVTGSINENVSLENMLIDLKINREINKQDVEYIEQFQKQLRIFGDTELVNTNKLLDMFTEQDIIEELEIQGLDKYVRNMKKVFKYQDTEIDELFKQFDLQKTNKQKLFIVNMLEKKLALSKNSVLSNLIGESNYDAIRSFLNKKLQDQDYKGVSLNIYTTNILKHINKGNDITDETLQFVGSIMSGSESNRILSSIVNQYMNESIPNHLQFDIRTDLLKKPEGIISETEIRNIIEDIKDFQKGRTVLDDIADQMQKQAKTKRHVIAGTVTAGIVALIGLGTHQKKKQRMKQQSLYPQQYQQDQDMYLEMQEEEPKYGYDIRQLSQLGYDVEEIVYQLSAINREPQMIISKRS